jgi:hypothetical protein
MEITMSLSRIVVLQLVVLVWRSVVELSFA